MGFIHSAAFILGIGLLWVQTLRLGSMVQKFKEIKEKTGEESVPTHLAANAAAPYLISSVILFILAIVLFFIG